MDHRQQQDIPAHEDERGDNHGDTQYTYPYFGDMDSDIGNGNFMPPPSEICREMNMMPSLQHVSSGVWSDASYQHFDHDHHQQLDYNNYYDDDVAASMENNEDPESDYDFDFSECAASTENEEEEDGEFEESCEDEEKSIGSDSDVDELVDQLQIKFQHLVSSTINAAEQYLDNPSTLHFAVLNNSPKFVPLSDSQVLDNLEKLRTVSENEKPESSQQLKINNETARALQGPIKIEETCHHVEVQTEDDNLLARSSGTIVPSNNDSLLNLKADQAELEINELQAVKESLIVELENWEVLLDEEGEMKTENEIKEAERIMCKINESIRAVEKAIDLKNEIVHGATATRAHRHRSSLSTEALNDMEFSKLVTNLDAISAQELQRMFGVYFEKTVELRYSSHELKNDLERATKRHEDLNRRYARKKERVREVQEQHKTRLLEFLSKNTDSSYYTAFRRKEEQLAAALKKQDGFEKALTTLLVRHGYLLDGMDYDVQQVVRTLGIDEGEGHSPSVAAMQGRVARRGGISEAGMSPGVNDQFHRAGGDDEMLDNHPSRRYDEKPSSSGRRRQQSGDRNVRFHNEPGCSNAPVRSDRSRVLSPPATHTHTAEVQRDRRRLIIHPSTTAAESGGSRGGGGRASSSPQKKSNHDTRQAGSGGRKKR